MPENTHKNTPLAAQILAANPQISAQVSANAGTGKTHVLAQRVLRLLLAEVAPSRIVCLTYTRTAAAEMSERISARLQKWAVISDADLASELEALTNAKPSNEQMKLARQLFAGVLNAMPPPRIQTIHSFCQEILKRFPLEAGLTPYFDVIDDVTSKELIAQAKQRIIHNQDDAKLLAALEYIAANTNESWFNDMLGEVVGQRNKFRKYFAEDKLIDGFQDEDEAYTQIKNYDIDLMRVLVREWTERPTKTHDDLLGHWNKFLASGEVEDYLLVLLTHKIEPRKKPLNKEALQANVGVQDLIAAEQERILNALDAWRSLQMLNLSYAVQQIADAFIRVYDELKAAKNVLDYADLLFYTNQLLQGANSAAWILYKLDGGIDHILVDEAQDASPEQWEIIQHITAEFFAGDGARDNNRSLFIVGDEKQSIYGFMGAEPNYLREVGASYGKAAIEAKKTWHKIPLSMSFRSLPKILQFVDGVFNEPLIKQAVSFAEEELLHEAHRVGQGEGLVELWPLFEADEYEPISSWELPVQSYKAISNEVDLAKAIVKKIRGWLRQGRVLKSSGKQVQAGDILILLRKRGKLADILVRKMKEVGIPVAGSDRLKLTEHIAIKDLVALADFCLFPYDNLALASALKSPIFAISEEELFEIAYSRDGMTLIQAIEKNSNFNELYKKIKAIQELAHELSPFEFFEHMLNNLDARSNFLARLGEEVNDPLDEFLDLVLQYENNHSRSMQSFLHWFKTSDYEIKRDMEARASEVRVMTIHAAKGLQAPIVFLPDTTSDYKKLRGTKKVFWNNTGKFFALQRISQAPLVLQELMQAEIEAEFKEYWRLLYVALTRAEDELYVCGTKGSYDIPEHRWYRAIEAQIQARGIEIDGVWRFGDAEFLQERLQELETEAKPNLPEFLFEKVFEPHEPQKRNFTGQGIEAISRGVKIHKFFEHYDSSRANIAADLAKQYLRDDALESEVLAVIKQPEFAEIFGENSMAEASILHEGAVTRLDRLIVGDDVVKIIDFKTGGGDARIYAAQMRKYAVAVAAIYPDKKVEAYIMWTNSLKLEVVKLDNL